MKQLTRWRRAYTGPRVTRLTQHASNGHAWVPGQKYNAPCRVRGCKEIRCVWTAPDILLHGRAGTILLRKGRQCRKARLPNGVYCTRHRQVGLRGPA